MNQEIKTKWLEALRSGNYKQGTGNLRRGINYCCLGVLCDIYHKETGKGEWKGMSNIGETFCFFAEKSKNTLVLPNDVGAWAEFGPININNPHITVGEDNDIEISYFNDSGYSFRKLADIIEKQL